MKRKEILAICLGAFLSCVAALAFAGSIEWLEEHLWEPIRSMSFGAYLGWSFVVLTIAGLASGWMMSRWAPGAAGSGIPQLKVAYWRDFGKVSLRSVVVKFLAGVVSIGGGMSLGKEGPTVFLGGGICSLLGDRMGMMAKARRTLNACGAAAGLAAAFNTPIAAVAFVMEEILENLNSPLMGRIMLASFVSVFALHWMMGTGATLELPREAQFDWVVFLAAAPTAAFAAAAGALFQQASLGSRRYLMHSSPGISPVVRPVLGAWVTWAVGALIFWLTGRGGILGLGFHDLNAALEGSFVWSTLLLLLCGKWLATVACYGSGGSGGIFAPCLFMGAMCGALWGEILELIGIIGPEGVEILAVTGMCALLCAVVRAPATAILIVFEMTHDFAIIPALMLGTLTALWVGRHMCPRNFYNQVVHDDGIDMEHHRPPETFADWKQRPVSQFANFSPCCVPLEDVEEARKIVERTGWRIYPVVDADGKFCGAATREAIARATDSVPVAGCGVAQPSTSARKAQQDMLESALDFLVVLDSRHRPIAVLTLHDLVRVQLAVMKE